MAPVEILVIESTGDGWMVKWATGGSNGGNVHLTAEWADELWRHQSKPNNTPNPALNQLRYQLRHGSPSVDEVAAWFVEAYGTVLTNRADRAALGLKAVTRHGHEDLEAVRAGAEVRPWNSANPKKPLHDWVKERHDK